MIQKLTSITQLLTSVLLALAVLSFPANSDPLKLAPFKDELFKYPGVLETGFKGDFVRVKYDKLIDIHKRDVVLEREVKRKYVSERTRWQRSAKRLNLSNFQMRYFAVGKTRKPVKFIVIYIHGSGGNRFQGVNDWTFGGNFNRIQNLTYRNNGLYLSPSFQDFKERGASQVASLILKYSKISPAAPIYIACGSKGGNICWRLTRDQSILPRLGGMLLFGSTRDERFFKSDAIARRLPVYLGHGSWDTVYPWEKQFEFFNRIKKRNATYPVKFTLFDTGTHGTPIRMTDWRLILNWMMSMKSG